MGALAETDRLCLPRTEPAAHAPGNLYRPAPGPGRASGGWHGRRRERVRRAVAAVTVGAGAVALLGRLRRTSAGRPEAGGSGQGEKAGQRASQPSSSPPGSAPSTAVSRLAYTVRKSMPGLEVAVVQVGQARLGRRRTRRVTPRPSTNTGPAVPWSVPSLALAVTRRPNSE